MKKQMLAYGNGMRMKVAFSDAISVDVEPGQRMVWISGQLALDEDENLVCGDMATQTEWVLKNIKKAIEKMGGTMDDIVNVIVYVKHMDDIAAIHRIRLQYFREPYPASTMIQVGGFVNPNALIEISAQAILDK